jgi:uncharacterized protein YjbI with pentapeptide repeats
VFILLTASTAGTAIVAGVKAQRAGEMARPWIRRTGRIAIATLVVVVAAGALLWSASFWWKRLSLPLDSQMVIASVVPTVLLLAAIWWLWWRLPRRQLHRLDIQIHDPKARADTEDNFRKTVGQALGGAAVLIGAVAAYLQFTQQQQASHDLLISNQVSKGFEQLASDKITERLGGIYALEGVMKTSDQYHQPVLEALCAFVRDSTLESVNDKAATDVQAALTVIGRRAEGQGDVNLVGASLVNADLNHANLRSAKLEHSDLTSANLMEANLAHASLDDAHLDGALLLGANMLLVSLGGAHLTHTTLAYVNLTGASLVFADLRGASLVLSHLGDTNLRNADLTDADMRDALNLTQEQLDQACGKPKALPPGLTLDKPCPPPEVSRPTDGQ